MKSTESYRKDTKQVAGISTDASSTARDADGLREILADTFVLYMKTFAVHWNYQGPNFYGVHKLTEGQYQDLATAIDELAERMRALGYEAPVSLHAITNASQTPEMEYSPRHADAMVEELINGHQSLSGAAKSLAKQFSEHGDVFSADMMSQRIGIHDKAAWMLKAILSEAGLKAG